MPFQSEKQRRYLFKFKPEIAKQKAAEEVKNPDTTGVVKRHRRPKRRFKK